MTTKVTIEIGIKPGVPKGNGPYIESGSQCTLFQEVKKEDWGYKEYICYPSKSIIWSKTVEIKHNGKGQPGFPNVSACKSMSVYYIFNDDEKLVPLAVKLCESNGTKKFYTRDHSNQWNYYSNEDEIPNKLHQMIEMLPLIPAIIHLDKTENYPIDKISQAHALPQVMVTESSTKSFGGSYVKYKHLPPRHLFRILSINHPKNTIKFKDRDGLDKEYAFVMVSYWRADVKRENPLILELGVSPIHGHKTHFFYANVENQAWVNRSKLHIRLLEEHDEVNCKLNHAHVVNISRRDNNNAYMCPACKTGHIKIDLKHTSSTQYAFESFLHEVHDQDKIDGSSGKEPYYIGRLRDDHYGQSGIVIDQKVKKVQVYWFKYQDKGETHNLPLLIHLGENKWYKRRNVYHPVWTEEKSMYSTTSDAILKKLRDIVTQHENDEKKTPGDQGNRPGSGMETTNTGEEDDNEWLDENGYDDSQHSDVESGKGGRHRASKGESPQSQSSSGISTIGIVVGVMVTGLFMGVVGKVVWDRLSPRMYHLFHNEI